MAVALMLPVDALAAALDESVFEALELSFGAHAQSARMIVPARAICLRKMFPWMWVDAGEPTAGGSHVKNWHGDTFNVRLFHASCAAAGVSRRGDRRR